MRRASPWARGARAALLFAGLVAITRPAAAQGEARVLVLRAEPAPGHEADPDLLARAEGATIAALVTLGLSPLRDERAGAPDEAATVEALAASRRADWVVRVRALPTQAGYVAQVEAIHPATGTRREGSAEIVRAQEVSQLVALLGPLLEPTPVAAEGAPPTTTAEPGAAATEPEAPRATEGPSAAPDGARPAEEEASGPDAAQQWLAREDERQESASRRAWEGRERYGEPRMLAQGGLALRPLTNDPGTGGARVMGAVELRFGLAFPKVKGLEWRGSLEAMFGAISGLSLMTGAVYLFSPWVDAPVHLGPGLEIGWLQSLEDQLRQAFFAARLSAVVSWRFHAQWYLEGALPEITILGGGGAAAATVGLAVRVGRRF
jgi:hypothetical protein